MKTATLNFKQISVNPEIQTRVNTDPQAVKDYAEMMGDGVKFPPLDVFQDGDTYYLADGFHRFAAGRSKDNDFMTFECNIHEGGLDAALWFALGANQKNGVRFTSGDKAKAIELAVNKFPNKTQQAIADQIGCSRQYVQKIQNELATSGKLPAPPPHKGNDGKNRPATYKKKAPGAVPPSPSGPPPKAAPAKVPSIVPGAVTDRTGLPIPPAILPLWERAEKGQELLSYITKVRTELKKAQEAGLLEFAEVNFSSAHSHLDQAYADIKVVKPFAVCPSCQGKATEDCGACKGRGYVSEFYYMHCVPSQVRDIRAKTIAPEKGKV